LALYNVPEELAARVRMTMAEYRALRREHAAVLAQVADLQVRSARILAQIDGLVAEAQIGEF